MKCWDLAGGEQYRNEWGRFTKGCDCILFVVDTNAIHLLHEEKKELHRLLEDRELTKTAVLVVANKIDLEPHATEPQLIRGINYAYNNEFVDHDDDDDYSDHDDIVLILFLMMLVYIIAVLFININIYFKS
jgi:GTPase SAR1 family protein